MEYYTVEKKNNLGEQYIELSVFQAITNHEVSKNKRDWFWWWEKIL